MRILAIETSCDETAVSIVDVTGTFPTALYEVTGNGLWSQASIHAEFGGVFPAIAKREHAQTLVPMLKKALKEAALLDEGQTFVESEETIREILSREEGLANDLVAFLNEYELPEVNLITVTNGPGLEPALWVGVSFAKALASIVKCPIVPVNHMEGHILASLYDVVEDNKLAAIEFPALALLISGGHTELVLMRDWTTYEKIGQTRDDAVGEAFDKVARMMELPYPGGPEISRRASEARAASLSPYKNDLPRPMLNSGDLDFSFSGLKTAIRYALEGKELSETDKQALSRDFEDVVVDVLIKKTSDAVSQYGVKNLIVGGGVSANQYLRTRMVEHFLQEYPDCEVYFPHRHLSTDNSVMIALAGHAHAANARTAGAISLIRADGNRSL
jgi:N6-L-threonylcarbamoyladenine synthase